MPTFSDNNSMLMHNNDDNPSLRMVKAVTNSKLPSGNLAQSLSNHLMAAPR